MRNTRRGTVFGKDLGTRLWFGLRAKGGDCDQGDSGRNATTYPDQARSFLCFRTHAVVRSFRGLGAALDPVGE
jgi:hypothetical protein